MTFASYNLDMQLVDTNNTKIFEYSSFIHKKNFQICAQTNNQLAILIVLLFFGNDNFSLENILKVWN